MCRCWLEQLQMEDWVRENECSGYRLVASMCDVKLCTSKYDFVCAGPAYLRKARLHRRCFCHGSSVG